MQASAGDTIWVYNGVYSWTIPHEWPDNLLIKAVAGQNSVIVQDDDIGRYIGGWQGRAMFFADDVHVTFDGINFDLTMNYNLAFTIWGEGVTFLNCDFDGNDVTPSLGSFGADGGEYDSMFNCKIHNFTFSGIRTGGKMLIDSCEIYDNCNWQWYQNGGIWTTSGSDLVKITRCRIYDNKDYAFKFRYNSSNIYFYNNLVYRNGGGISAWGPVISTSGCRFISNTIVKNLRHGFVHYGGSNADTIKWNIIYWNGQEDTSNYYDFYESGNGTAPLEKYNDIWRMYQWEKGMYTMGMDPQFVDTTDATQDYHLQASSPCIDITGYKGSGEDLDGKSRPMPVGSSWDMGCYEEQTATKSDMEPPDNDMSLEVFSYSDTSFIFYWDPGVIDSVDAELVGIFYKTTDYPDSADDPTAVFLKAYR